MKRHMAFAASVVLLVTAIGCRRRGPPPGWDAPPPSKPLPTAPISAHFVDGKVGRKFVTDGHPEYTFTVTYDGPHLYIEADDKSDWPYGTNVVLGEETQPLVKNIKTSFDPSPFLGALPISEKKHANDPVELAPPGELIVRFRNDVEIAVPLPKGTFESWIAAHVMEEAAKTGLTFAGETDHTGPHTTYYVRTFDVVGPGTKLVDADWIAVTTDTTATLEGTKCEYEDGRSYPIELQTWTVTILERRTKREIAHKAFKPSRYDCPSFAMGGHARLFPDTDPILAWIRATEKAH